MTKHKKTKAKKSQAKKDQVKKDQVKKGQTKGTRKLSLPIRNILIFLYYLLMPMVLVFSTVRFFSFTNLIWLAAIYIITLVSIVLFFVFKLHHCKINILAYVLGLLLSPLYAYISDARWVALSRALLGENWLDFSYLNTNFAILFYTFPLAFLAIIVLIIVLVLRARKKMMDSNK